MINEEKKNMLFYQANNWASVLVLGTSWLLKFEWHGTCSGIHMYDS